MSCIRFDCVYEILNPRELRFQERDIWCMVGNSDFYFGHFVTHSRHAEQSSFANLNLV
jgi:hypothetical protein